MVPLIVGTEKTLFMVISGVWFRGAPLSIYCGGISATVFLLVLVERECVVYVSGGASEW